MLGFGTLGQFALGTTELMRQDLINVAQGGGYSGSDRRRRRRMDDDDIRRAYERRRDFERRKAKRRWIQRDYEVRRQDAERRARTEELRRARAEALARRLEQERQQLLAEALLAVGNIARQAELAAHIQRIEAMQQELYLRSLDDDVITVLLLDAA